MSLLPSYATAAAFGGIPVLFLEARVQCNPGEVITQMGLSLNADNVDVSMLSKSLVLNMGLILLKTCSKGHGVGYLVRVTTLANAQQKLSEVNCFSPKFKMHSETK